MQSLGITRMLGYRLSQALTSLIRSLGFNGRRSMVTREGWEMIRKSAFVGGVWRCRRVSFWGLHPGSPGLDYGSSDRDRKGDMQNCFGKRNAFAGSHPWW